MMKQPTCKTVRSLRDLTPDTRNANRHTARGAAMMDASIREAGFGDSLTVDREGRIISGHQRAQTLADLGLVDAIVVQSDGTKPIVHQRVDLDLSTDARAQKLALFQNRVGQANLDWSPDAIQSLRADGVDLTALWTDRELKDLLQPPPTATIKTIDTSDVDDEFWIAVRGPLALQASTLHRLRTTLQELAHVSVDLGTVDRDRT